ncbi:MAG: hypothetical protein JWQ16_906 [Novosphingobium sp.]|nr:hypothetical protein [Novosphingobium sp.]
MFGFVKKAALGVALAATAMAASSPAQARDRWHRGNDGAAVAVGAGVLGLALGAAIASDRRDRYYDDGYYYRSYPRYRPYGYYGPPPRFYRYDRPYRGNYYRRDYYRGYRHW